MPDEHQTHPIEALDPQFKADAQTVADLTGPDADVERIEGLVLDRRATQEGRDDRILRTLAYADFPGTVVRPSDGVRVEPGAPLTVEAIYSAKDWHVYLSFEGVPGLYAAQLFRPVEEMRHYYGAMTAVDGKAAIIPFECGSRHPGLAGEMDVPVLLDGFTSHGRNCAYIADEEFARYGFPQGMSEAEFIANLADQPSEGEFVTTVTDDGRELLTGIPWWSDVGPVERGRIDDAIAAHRAREKDAPEMASKRLRA